ncbi:hypothetical protein GQR58_000517 [Nymphon striatum]|nr:hypothetical protein GQR58_000517 [Nymphon striatum]
MQAKALSFGNHLVVPIRVRVFQIGRGNSVMDKLLADIDPTHKTARHNPTIPVAINLNFAFHKGLKRILLEYFSGQTNALTEILPILFLAHIIKPDHRRSFGIFRAQCDRPARRSTHWPDMGLKPMPLGQGLPVIAHSNWQEMELDVRVSHASARTNKSCTFKLVRGPKPCFGEQPLGPDQRLGHQIPVLIKGDRLAGRHLKVDL